ncbi:hypothetical protein KC338_g3359 [Hortaea werneckii]|uniref:Uncharacterized protein n=1 Tax=Hortaea werneckii TaxID=91943 RepID=A0A3M7HEM8_HORWE|nr:hypothetical protein KC338_g3359 [Hortaea werneckii]KAI7354265.1 hypothetical protein KC320_g3546 [Hortaea werneckii]RMZ11729.1 hypothetical protein D0862_02862 [Hortaea werneckii]
MLATHNAFTPSHLSDQTPAMASKRAAETSRTQSGASSATSRSEASSGSKPSSPSEQQKSQIDFQFLNFSHPSDAKASRARRTVRSHVTRQQHAREQQHRAQSYHGQASELAQVPESSRRHAVTMPSERPTTLELPESSRMNFPFALSPEDSSPSPSPLVSPSHSPGDRVDAADVYPEAWLPHIPRVLEGYLSNLVVDIPGVDPATVRELLRTRFYPFITTDAATMHTVILVAASRFTKLHGVHSHGIELLSLRGMAIREINAALEDPRRATSDQLVTAVAKMASYEALFGDRNVCHTHMTALLRMVTLRGGLPQLGLDGLLERLLLWIDANATCIMDRPKNYFDKDAFPTTAVHPRPNPQKYVPNNI